MADFPDNPHGLPSSNCAPRSGLAVFFWRRCPVRWLSMTGLLALFGGIFYFASQDAEERGAYSPSDFSRPLVLPSPARERIGGVDYSVASTYFAALGFESVYTADRHSLAVRLGSDRTLNLLIDKREARLDGMRIFLGEPVLLHRGQPHVATVDLERFLTPMLRPSWMPTRPLRTIVLDAGHGGVDSGTSNQRHELQEKVFTLDVARRLQALLGDDPWNVLLTRSEDRFVSLGDRAKFANAAAADLFVSIHFNAVAGNAEVRGTETYILTPQYQRSTSAPVAGAGDLVEQVGNRHDVWSAVLGYEMHRHLLRALGTEDRGLKRARFAVLRLVDCPAVLVEAGYLSNDTEALRIAEAAYRREIAEALHAAILAYDARLNSAVALPTP